MKNHILLAMASTIMLCGCNGLPSPDNGDDPKPDEPQLIPINLTTDIWMKATDNGYEVNDKVGIYTVNYVDGTPGTLVSSGNHLDNTCFTYDGTAWSPETPVYWKDSKTPADFYCYYPYTASVSDVSSLEFTVKEDQSTLDNYKASDLLWGKTEGAEPSDKPVNILTKHALSNIVIYVVPGDGFTEESLAAEDITVTITGVKTKAGLNLATGKVTADGDLKDIRPYKENGWWRALVVPQDIIGTQIVKVTVGEDTYTLTQTVTFESNKQHKCTVKVNRIGEGVNITIGGWESSDEDFGGTLE